MRDIEKDLKEYAKKMQTKKAPANFEDRMRNRLYNQPPKRKGPNKKFMLIAASFMVFFLFAYQFDTIAYYGKKILGYDTVLTDSMAELNNEGKGQVIGRSVDLPDGGTMTVDGLMLDDNQLVILYTLYDPDQKVEDLHLNTSVSLHSFFGEIHMDSGRGSTSEDGTTMTKAYSFEPPNPFVKELTLQLTYDNDPEKFAEVSFQLDRSKALMTKYKQKINQTIKTNTADYIVKELVATPTQTVFKGKIHVKDRSAWQSEMVTSMFEFSLKADDEPVQQQGLGYGTEMLHYYFEVEFDALKGNPEELTLKLEKGLETHQADSKTDLDQEKINLANQTIAITNVTESKGKTEITLNAENEFDILEAELIGSNIFAKLEKAYIGDYFKAEDGMRKELVLVFDGTIEGKRTLHITKYVTIDPVDKTITIPVK
ncbi:DUF4179 domain-containing protein [Pseudalkalibacillus sp. SCS-8]|uniref:DUF4179 domain-containing protein n=1 Tax=Pseudalkalibacillus nanhaiensis TaxID=3115291 RepID=UPI0032DB1413